MTRVWSGLWTCVLASVVALDAGAQADGRANDVVMRAMRDELSRSMEELRLDTLAKPYFIAYRLTEGKGHGAAARLGSLLGAGDARGTRFLQVEVRVGDYAFDNTNFMGGGGFFASSFFGFGLVPVDDDYQEIRRQIWLSTDRAYKQALEALSQKRAALETRSRPDELPDFSREAVFSDVDERAAPAADRTQMESLVRSLSNAFRATPEIYNSRVGVNASWSLIRYVNSEGTWFTRSVPRVGLNVVASTQASDGMPLADFYDVSAQNMAELPGRDSLMAAVRGLAARLTSLRQAPLASSYEGPVLFEGDAAVELFSTLVGPKLVASRRPVASAQYERMLATATNDWMELVGTPVLSRSLTVVDDPTLRSVEGVRVDGFRIDDDGVRTRPTTVVDRGILKTLLTTRVPVTGIEKSTGNRRGGGAAPSNVIVTADSGISAAELRQKLLALATARGLDHGIVVRRIANPRQTAQTDPSAMMMGMISSMSDQNEPRFQSLAAFKVYTDGREELMRGAEITGLNAASFKTLVAASRSRTVSTAPFVSRGGPFGGGGGSGNVTYVMPSLLFDNVSLRRPRGGNPKLPVVPPPTQSERPRE